MSWIVRQYPGQNDPKDTPIITLAQHGSKGEARIDVFGRAARWAMQFPLTRNVGAPKDDNGEANTTILWENNEIACVLNAEPLEIQS